MEQNIVLVANVRHNIVMCNSCLTESAKWMNSLMTKHYVLDQFPHVRTCKNPTHTRCRQQFCSYCITCVPNHLTFHQTVHICEDHLSLVTRTFLDILSISTTDDSPNISFQNYLMELLPIIGTRRIKLDLNDLERLIVVLCFPRYNCSIVVPT
jgi:hypothetical protein